MIREYETGERFLADNKDFLDTNPYLAVFFYWDSPLLKVPDEKNYAIRCDAGEKRLLALKAEPFDLLLFGAPELSGETVHYLKENGLTFENFLCACDVGEALSEVLSGNFGLLYEETLAMEFMEATEVTEPSSEEVETPAAADLDEIVACLENFIKDCGLQEQVNIEKTAKSLESFRVIRKDGRIASMAKAVNASEKDMKVTSVYTRDEYRGQGLARKVVNTVKNEILSQGKLATLNVDRRNPVTNHLYRSLGFRPLFSQGEYRPKAGE